MSPDRRPFELASVPDPGGLPFRAAATIGVFDGVHRGHEKLFSRVRAAAAEVGAASVVVTFEPHPIEVFAPETLAHRIGSRAVNARWIRAAGVDHVWFLPFSREMASWPPERFVRHLLAALELTDLWVGADFRFGRDRTGDVEFLREFGLREGFRVHTLEPVLHGDRVISSTWVRECLIRGEIETANDLLGHPFELEGRVVHGQGLGARELVPTANLELLPGQILPRRGIYAGWAFDPERRWAPGAVPAVASLGVRPTLGAGGQDWVEVHLIDWQGSIYDETLAFRFLHWIRPEESFPDLETLRAAIHGDLAAARRRLGNTPHTSALHPGG